MASRIAKFFVTVFLIIFPFLVGTTITKYSPYIEGNGFYDYVWIWSVISIVAVGACLLLIKYLFSYREDIFYTKILLFLLAVPIIGIVGLASAPDLTINMLQHPEREHFRYILLFLAAALFGFSFFLFLSNKTIKLTTTVRWLMVVLFVFAFGEFLYEFTHHYLYPEAMKSWIDKGNKVEDFGKTYDNIVVIGIGAIGRIFQFTLIALFSFVLYQLKKVNIWSPVISFLFCCLGIVSAFTVFLTQMNLPKGFEFLFLFFIPGIPFLLFYWIGVALLTTSRRKQVT